MAATKTNWVVCPFGLFELRPSKTPLLHSQKGVEKFGKTGHDYTTTEIRGWAHYCVRWRYASNEYARVILSSYQKRSTKEIG